MQRSELDELRFEERDKTVFDIPDTTTKLDTLQNYFFPRLDRLLDLTVQRIHEIYGSGVVDDSYTIGHTPAHRTNAKKNVDLGYVGVGLNGRRQKTPLRYVHPDGKPFYFASSRLRFMIMPEGTMAAALSHLLGRGNIPLRDEICAILSPHWDEMLTHLEISHIVPRNWYQATAGCPDFPLHRALDHPGMAEVPDVDFWLNLTSPAYYFPVTEERGLGGLAFAFANLFPLLDVLLRVEKGQSPRLAELLAHRREWLNKPDDESDVITWDVAEESTTGKAAADLLELDSYQSTRAGVWWAILARDSWTCCSCRRSHKEHGVVLHVDHIKPRSLGGTNELANLQTLCWKCNIGKSNRDDTDLHAL